MNFPLQIEALGIGLPAHLVFDLLAYYLGFGVFLLERRRRPDPLMEERRQVIIVAAIGGAFVGSTVLGAVEHLSLFLNPPNLLFYLSNKTVVGGLLGGWLAVEIVKKIIGERRSSGDLFVLPLISGIALGRVGCFLTGVTDKTVGLPSDVFWAMDQGDGILRHPTSLYEIAFLLVLASVLSAWRAVRPVPEGVFFKVFLGSYCAFRLCVDFVKPREPILFGFSTIQLGCLACLCYYCLLVIRKIAPRCDSDGVVSQTPELST